MAFEHGIHSRPLFLGLGLDCLLALLDGGQLFVQGIQHVSLGGLYLRCDGLCPLFELLHVKRSDFFDRHGVIYSFPMMLTARSAIAARFSASSCAFCLSAFTSSMAPSRKRALMLVPGLAGRLTALTSNSFPTFVM